MVEQGIPGMLYMCAVEVCLDWCHCCIVHVKNYLLVLLEWTREHVSCPRCAVTVTLKPLLELFDGTLLFGRLIGLYQHFRETATSVSQCSARISVKLIHLLLQLINSSDLIRQ